MKNIFRFLFLFLFTSNTLLFGQKDSLIRKRNFEIGLLGGVDLLNFQKSGYSSLTFLVGPSAGLHFQKNFSKRFSIIAELAYENKKYTMDYQLYGNAVELEYYSLPLMIRGHIGKHRLLFINGGIYFSVISITNMKNYYKSAELTTNDLGGIIGAGIRIPLTKKFDLTIEGRESFSMLLSRFPGFVNDPVRTNTSFILLGINYKFQFTPIKSEDGWE